MSEETFSTQSTDSNNDVFNAYNELLRKLQDPSPTVITPEVEEAREQQVAAAAQVENVVQTAVDVAYSDIPEQINFLKTSVTDFLSDVQHKLLGEQDKVRSLHEAIAHQQKQLENLYEIRANADTLQALINAHQEKSVTLDEDIQTKRNTWANEQAQHEQQVAERNARVADERQREEADFTARRDLTRQREQDQYEAAKRQAEQELTAKRLQQEDEFRTRETTLARSEIEHNNYVETTKRQLEQEYLAKRAAAEEELREREMRIVQREQEFLLLKERIDKFPEELQRMAEQTEKQVKEHMTMKFEYELKLAHQEFEAERQLHHQDLSMYQQQIENLETVNYAFKPMAYNATVVPKNKSV